MTEDQAYDAWKEAVDAAYQIARGERLGELRGRRPKTFDRRGLHPFSTECGRIMALQALVPRLAKLDFNHLELRRAAFEDAEQQYEQEIMAKLHQKSQDGGEQWTNPERAQGEGSSHP